MYRPSAAASGRGRARTYRNGGHIRISSKTIKSRRCSNLARQAPDHVRESPKRAPKKSSAAYSDYLRTNDVLIAMERYGPVYAATSMQLHRSPAERAAVQCSAVSAVQTPHHHPHL